MQASTGVGALGAMAAFLQHSPRERSYDDLTDAEVEEIGRTLDALREEVLDSRGARDAAYIRRRDRGAAQLELGGRVVLLGSRSRAGVGLGTAGARPGQDPGQHGDRAQRAPRPVGLDARPEDPLHRPGTGTTPRRRRSGSAPTTSRTTPTRTSSARTTTSATASCGSTRRRSGSRATSCSRCWNLVTACIFEYGIAMFDLDLGEHLRDKRGCHPGEEGRGARRPLRKAARQADQGLRDLPGCSPATGSALDPRRERDRQPGAQPLEPLGDHVRPLPRGRGDLRARPSSTRTRRAGEWYVRQMLGSANISGPPLLHLMAGNLSHQIEHHIFPDLPEQPVLRDRAAGCARCSSGSAWPTTRARCPAGRQRLAQGDPAVAAAPALNRHRRAHEAVPGGAPVRHDEREVGGAVARAGR